MYNMVFHLVYTSKASVRMSEVELLTLLEQSRRNNAVLQITGMLLYMESAFMGRFDGRFIQLLEGDKASVQMIYQRIVADERNHGALLLRSGNSKERSFPGWSMGFRVLDKTAYSDVAGFFELDEHFRERDASADLSAPLAYLRSFYKVNGE